MLCQRSDRPEHFSFQRVKRRKVPRGGMEMEWRRKGREEEGGERRREEEMRVNVRRKGRASGRVGPCDPKQIGFQIRFDRSMVRLFDGSMVRRFDDFDVPGID